MRFTFFCLIAMVLAATGVSGAVVTRQMPSSLKPGETFTVVFVITSAVPGKLFTLEETRPQAVNITSWSVEGAVESKSKIETRAQDKGFGWSFTTSGTDAKIRYTAKVSETAQGTLHFDAVFFDPNGFNRSEGTITLPGQPQPTPRQQPPSGPASGASAQNRQRPSWRVGAIIIASILLIGLAVSYHFTRKKRHTPPVSLF